MPPRLQGLMAAAAVGLAVLLFAGWADAHAAHGLTVEWWQPRDGAREVIAQTTEHRVQFPNEHRALARYIQGWDFEGWGVPRRLPTLDARLRGTLHIPPGESRLLRLVSPNETRILLGDQVLEPEARVPPGAHPMELHWVGRFEREASLAIEWSTDGHRFDPIPSTAWTPASGPWPPLRIGLWIFAAALGLTLTWLAWWAGTSANRRQAWRRWGAFATLVVALLSLSYRACDYAVMPEFRENYDELFATWNGWSLLHEGETRGWSLWAGRYEGRVDVKRFHYFSPRPFNVIQPYFEHPPLLHVAVGAAATLGGASHWAHARLAHTRTIPIALGVLTTLLIIAVARRLDPRSAGPYLAGLLYAVLPIIALQGRVIKEEALVAPLALGSLWFFLRWRDGGERTTDLAAAALLAGFTTLAKVPGFIFVVALVMLVLQMGRPRHALVAAGLGVAAAAPLLLFAAAIDWDVFWFTTLHQASGRPSHWNLFPRFFDDPLINHNLVGRPWLLFLWLAFALALRSLAPKDRAVLVVPALLYLLGMGFSSGNWTFGWYLMPVYPFLCIGAGRFLADLWERPDLLRGTLFITLAVMYGMSFTQDPQDWMRPSAWPETRRAVMWFLVPALAPYALAQVSRARAVRALARLATAGGLAMLVALSGYFVAHYEQIYETHRNFDRLEFFDR